MKTIEATLVEAACIGAVLALAMYVAVANRGAWMISVRTLPEGAPSAACAAFVLGAAFHLGCQVSGLNEWYARTYFQ